MGDEIRPFDDDSTKDEVTLYIEEVQGEIVLVNEFTAAAVETMKNDGSGHQQVVMFTLGGKVNNKDEVVERHFMINTDSMPDMIRALITPAAWIEQRNRMSN